MDQSDGANCKGAEECFDERRRRIYQRFRFRLHWIRVQEFGLWDSGYVLRDVDWVVLCMIGVMYREY
jgi:hypothetical protein